MEYGVIGNYGHANLGDEAILRGMISILERNKKTFIVFTDDVSKSLEMHQRDLDYRLLRPQYNGRFSGVISIVISLVKAVLSVKTIIIGGGGLFNQINKTALFQYLFLIVVAWVTRRRVILAGISVGPLDSKIYKMLLRVISYKAEIVLTRDLNSLKYFSNKNLYKIPDLSLAYKYPCIHHRENNTLGVSVMDISPSKGETKQACYIDSIVKIVSNAIGNNEFSKVSLFCMDFKKDKEIALSVYARLSKECAKKVDIVILETMYSVDRFFDNIDFVVGTRLHSSILSILYQKPFIAIGYQPKVDDYFISHRLAGKLMSLQQFINDSSSTNLQKKTNIEDMAKEKKDAYRELDLIFNKKVFV